MFGKTVLDIEGDHFEHALDQAKADAGVTTDVELGVAELQALVATLQGHRRGARRASTSRRIRASSSTSRSGRLRLVEHRPRPAVPPPGAHPRTTSAPRSTCRRWCSATSATTPAPASRSPATPRPARTGALRRLPARRAGRGRRRRHPQHADPRRPRGRSTRRRTPQLLAIMTPLETHYRTCATSSSPSSAASCGCCRPASASAPRLRPSGSPTQLVDEGVIDDGRGRCAACPAPSSRS